MDPNTLNLIIFAEQMAALAAKTILDLKNVLTSGADATSALNDADATYQQIIANAKKPPTLP